MNDSEINKNLMNMFSSHSSNEIANYHNFIARLMNREYKRITDEEPEGIEKNILLQNINNYDKYLLNSTFINYYSYAEEWILLKIRRTKYDHLIDSPGSIQRFKKPLSVLGIDSSNNIDWQNLANAEHIRNCLSHANGNISLTRTKILNIIENDKNLIINTKRLYVTAEYINKFKKSIQRILDHSETENEEYSKPHEENKSIFSLRKLFSSIKKIFIS